MRRREFLTLAGAMAVLPLTARAQSHGPMPRIAMYSASEPLDSMNENSYNRYIRTVFAEMRRLGLVEAKTTKISRETPDIRSKETMARIVDSKPDTIFCVGAGAVFQREPPQRSAEQQRGVKRRDF